MRPQPIRLHNIPVASLLLCASLFHGMAGAASAPWWNKDWTCRKTVEVTPVGPFNQSLAAAATFTTGGALRKGAADLRILDETGLEVPYHVIASDFEDVCTVTFPVRRAKERFHFYYGNPKASGPRHDWRPKRGLVLEVRTMGKGAINNWRQMKELIEKSPEVQGRALHPCVFDGHNRFGPSDGYISIYRGFLYFPQSGDYGIATTSDDASVLFLDSEIAVQWPGHHGAVADARHHTVVNVTQGVHHFEYYHVETSGEQVAEAAWRLPGAERFEVIPPAAFVPFWWGRVTAYEQVDDPAPADFSYWQESSLPAGDSLISAVRFNVDFPTGVGGRDVEWSFGDGLTSDVKNPTHVYAMAGEYRVRLTIGDKQVSQQIRVWHNERIADVSSEDTAAEYLKAIRAQDLSRQGVDALLALREFARDWNAGDIEYQAMAVLAGDPETHKNARAGRALLEHAGALWRMARFDDSLDVLQNLASRHRHKEVALEALHTRGEYLLALGKLADARSAFQSLEHRTSGRQQFRDLAGLGMGDYYRARGDAEAAGEAYRGVQSRAAKLEVGESVVRGAHAQAALEYLRAGHVDAALSEVERWGSGLPLDRLDGYYSLLRTIALIKFGDLARGLAEARDQFAVNPDGNYAPHMLLLQGDCLALWGKADEAGDRYRRLIEEYPESHLRPVAEVRAQNPPRELGEIRFPVLDF